MGISHNIDSHPGAAYEDDTVPAPAAKHPGQMIERERPRVAPETAMDLALHAHGLPTKPELPRRH